MRFTNVLAAALVVVQASQSACSGSGKNQPPIPQIEPVYDATTGKLRLLQYDSNGDGKTDTWSYMDGSRVVRIEVDRDGDGRIDQWQYYDPNQNIQKIGFSLKNDGKEDAWCYLGPDGAITRVESSPRGDGKVSRTEHFEKNTLTRAEEDTDGDGRPDKWETYQESRLVEVAFDTAHHGTPDRRIVYGRDASGHLEIDSRGNGQFVDASSAQPPVKSAQAGVTPHERQH